MIATAKKFQFHKVFSSHMVLQRDRKIVLSGTATPGKTVKAVFDKTEKTARAGKDGEWTVSFPALPAGGPHKITLSGAKGVPPVVLDDVLMGEVWICTGQSNMAFALADAIGGKDEYAKDPNLPEIRIFDVTAHCVCSAKKPLKETPGTAWTYCTKETLPGFTACGYYFGKQLYKDLKVPIGLISDSFGGTIIEAWISKAGMKSVKRVQHYSALENYSMKKAAEIWAKEVLPDKAIHDWVRKFNALGGKEDQAWIREDFDDSAWNKSISAQTVPNPCRFVSRMYFDLPAEYAGAPAQFHIGQCSDTDITWINGRKIGETTVDDPVYYGIHRKYSIPAGVLHAGKNVITMCVDNHWGIGNIWGHVFDLTIRGKKLTPELKNCRNHILFEVPADFPQRPDVPGLPADPEYDYNLPSTLYNSMFAPWHRYAIRGAIWYQGCSNNGQISYYLTNKALIEDFRKNWNDPKMPFLVVQLAAFYNHAPTNRFKDEFVNAVPFREFPQYAVTREIQAQLAKDLPNVGVVTAFDKGDHSDIHPKDKKPIGTRLAKRAENMVYGAKESGKSPEYRRMTVRSGETRIEFSNAESGLVTTDGKAPKGFWLGDRSGNLFPAKDVSIDGSTIVIKLPMAVQVERVRYAFTDYCEVNVTNREGLPILPFRTDKPDYKTMWETSK